MKRPRMPPLRDRYGASPLHLLLVLCSFALALYAGLRLLKGDPVGVALWFVGAALLHDLVLLPLYTLTDRALQLLLPAPDRRPPPANGGRVNYVRIPGLVSLLLLVVWYPLILRRVPGYQVSTGLSAGSFLGHWLLITAALFAASGLCLLTAMARGSRRTRRTRRIRRRKPAERKR